MTTRARKQEAAPAAADAVCEKCGNYGYILDSNGVARPCDCGCRAERRTERLMLDSGIPRLFLKKDFDNFKVAKGDRERQAVLAAARAYATSFHSGEEQGLLLQGITGCGKTHIAVAILKHVIGRGFTGRYANLNDLLSRMRDSYSRDSEETEGRLLAEIDDAELLVLDDVGAEAVRDWMRDRLYLIINRRYENGRATIITTNCNEDELLGHVGERIASRLYEMCSRDFPPFPRQDWRRANMR